MTAVLGQATILVVDDVHENIDVLGGILRVEYKVKAATSGAKALEIVKKSECIDLILLDIMMPDMDGYEVCRELKADEKSKDIPVIFVSALQDIDDRVKGFTAGGADFLIKPIQPEEVLARVKVHVENVRMQRQLRQAHDLLESRVAQRTQELKSANESLHEMYRRIVHSEELYRGLLEASPDGVVLVNEAGEIELANMAMCELFGYSSDELKGMTVDRLVPQGIHGHEIDRSEYIHRPAHKNDVSRSTLYGLKKDGSEFPVDISLSLVANENGDMVIADIRDQTERLWLEEQLNQAQKMESLGRLTGGIAHDFNNILCIIISYAELALDEKTGKSKLDKCLAEILRAGERARDLVAQMLLFSRKGGRKVTQVVELSPLLTDSMKMLSPLLPSSIDFKIDIDNGVVLVKVDPIQINQLVMNLCINARDAMDENGQIELGVRHVEMDAGTCSSCYQSVQGEFVEVSVTDTGPGIDTETLRRVFEPFYTTKDVGKGTGMGLSMVHGIMHSCAGHIIVDSVPGLGCRFLLLFPMVQLEAAGCSISDDAEEMDYSGEGQTILIVDDEVAIGLFLNETLSNLGYKVVCFPDSLQALEYFNANSDEVDLVITDQTMPRLSGIDLAQAMLKRREDLLIILVTGYSNRVNSAQSKVLGFSAFFEKPFDTKSLLKEIKSLLSS